MDVTDLIEELDLLKSRFEELKKIMLQSGKRDHSMYCLSNRFGDFEILILRCPALSEEESVELRDRIREERRIIENRIKDISAHTIFLKTIVSIKKVE